MRKKALMSGILVGSLMMGNMSVTSYAGENSLTKEDIMAIPGLVSIKMEVGDLASNPGLISDSKNEYVNNPHLRA